MNFEEYVNERYQNNEQTYELIKGAINRVLFNGFDRSGIDYRLRLISDTKFILDLRIPVYNSKMKMLPRLKERLKMLGINCDYRRNSGPSSTHHYIHFTVNNSPSLDRGDTYTEIVNVLDRVLYNSERSGENSDYKISFVRNDRFCIRYNPRLYWDKMSGEKSLIKIRKELTKVFGDCTYSISSNRYPFIYVYYNIPNDYDSHEETNYEEWYESLTIKFNDFINENNHIDFIEKIEEYEDKIESKLKEMRDEKDNFIDSGGYRFGQWLSRIADVGVIIIDFDEYIRSENDKEIYNSTKPIILRYYKIIKKELDYIDGMIKSERLNNNPNNQKIISDFYKICKLIEEINI